MELQINSELRDFIVNSYLFGDISRELGDDTSLIKEGIVDSTGVLELIEFLEAHFGIAVSDTETVPDNLGSIANLTRFVMGKLTGRELGAAAGVGQAG